ncbi:MAG TPA: DUF1254 domain-containing protein [Vicinamibacterales bacterium]|nr:DUF1254 domain-containing protein [Vicinamibacterales bacterium]
MANEPQKGPTTVRRVTAPEPPPATVQTRFTGTLQFNGGYPTDETVRRLYDQIDFQRGCQVFLRHLMAAAVWGFRQAFVRDVKVGPTDLAMLHLDANGLLLTGNSETIYGTTILDLKPYGPMVVDVPPRVLGLLNDQWMRPLGDVGIAGPDHGKGGRYLLVPPGYDTPLDEKGFVATIRPRTYRVWYIVRAFMGPGGDPAPAFETHRQTKIYPLDTGVKAPATQHVDLSGKPFDTIHPTDIRYFEDLAAMVDYEPYDAIDAEESAMLKQIGIEKGMRFAPDARLKDILEEAAKVGSFMATATCYAPRDEYKRYTDRQWFGNVAGYPSFRDERGRPLVDEMVRMAWFATGRAQAMGSEKPGVGSAYTWCYRDAKGQWLDSSRTYKLRLPGPIPAKDFWSIVVYDLWTRSMLANGRAFPSLNSYAPGIAKEADGSVEVYIGPKAPAGKEQNWIPTPAGTAWFPLLRFYGPLEPWIDRSWKPGDLEAV